MNIDDFHTNFDQAERPDLRLWLSFLLMIIGLIIMATTSKSVQTNKPIENSSGIIKPSDIKAMARDNPNSIENLTQDEVMDLFGTPDFLRGEADILIWQYKSNACVLEIYWQSDKEAKFIARHVSIRRGEISAPNCIDSLF